MKKITRRLLAVMLCALLALAAPCALAQEGLSAQMVIVLGDGSEQMMPVEQVDTSLGETVYWLDMSILSEEEIAALEFGQLVLIDEAGDVLAQLPLEGNDAVAEGDALVVIPDPLDPAYTHTLMLAPMALPEMVEDAEAVLAEYGYFDADFGEAYTEEYIEEYAEEYIEEYIEEYTEAYAEEYTEEYPDESGEDIHDGVIIGEDIHDGVIIGEDIHDGVIIDQETEEYADEYTDEYEEEPEQILVPAYVMPMDDGVGLYSEMWIAEETTLALLGYSDVVMVYGYQMDDEGNIWWEGQDYRTGLTGYVMAEMVAELEDDLAGEMMAQIETEIQEALAEEERQAEEAARQAEEERLAQEQREAEEAARQAEEEERRAEAERLAQEQARLEEEAAREAEEQARLEQEAQNQQQAEEPIVELIVPETDASADADETEAEPETETEIEPETGTEIEDENEIEDEAGIEDENEIKDGTEIEDENEADEPAVRYAVTSNGNSDVNNLRERAESKAPVVGEYKNGELVIIGEPEQDGKWYPVTVVRDGVQGYMRDYLLTEIPESDAQARMADILAEKAESGEIAEIVEPEYPELIVPDDAQEDEEEPETEAETETVEPEYPELIVPDGAQEDEHEEEEQAGQGPALIESFPAYGMTLAQGNNAMIVLRPEPVDELPNGAIPMIREPSPLELSELAYDEDGGAWYLARNMSTDETGYIEAYKVEEVSREEAEANIREVVSIIKPIEGEGVENVTEDDAQESEDEVKDEVVSETQKQPEKDMPQELTEGDVYHYGRTNAAQVALREAAKQSADLRFRMEKGTILWVMALDGEWCHVRTDRGEGYVKAEFVELMDVREEQEYRATLADPEVAPEREQPEQTQPEQTQPEQTQPEQPEEAKPEQTDPNYPELITPEPEQQPEIVEPITPEPTEEPTPEPTEEPTPEPTEEPTPEPTLEPTEEPTPEPTATPEPQRLEIYARVMNDATPLRGNPDANAYLQTILAEEDVVYIFQSQFAADGMMWYLVQFSGQWGYVRADLVRPMGEQETADYLAKLEAELATPTPMPQATPEPVGPDSTSAYAKLIKDAVNLRRTPSASGTSLGRIGVNTLLLVMGQEYDGTYTWYQVNYNGKDGYIRSDMAQMLTIAELQDYLAEQAQQSQTSKPSASVTPNSSNNTSITINGSELADLIPVDDSWTNNVISGMPSYATATPDPNATPTPVPPAVGAALIGSSGTLTVSNVPAMTESGEFSVYGKVQPYSTVTASVEMQVELQQTAQASGLIARAIAESVQTVKRTVGQTVADANGQFAMDVKLPQPGEYIVEFASADGSYARYGVTYDAGATPEPTAAPLPTAQPVQEDSGMGILPFVIGGLLIVVAAAVYGVYVYRRRAEEEDEDEEDEDEEEELRQEQLNIQRQRRAESAARPVNTTAPRMPQSQGGQVPSYMRNTQTAQPSGAQQRVSPYARPIEQAPTVPQAPVAPKAPTAPQAPVAPKAPTAPQAPVAPNAPIAPQAPVAPDEPTAPTEGTARRRRRRPVDTDINE